MENHNFHIHQTKFRFIPDNGASSDLDEARRRAIREDNVPLPNVIPGADIVDQINRQNGYCTMDQWTADKGIRDKCTSTPVIAELPLSLIHI